MGSSPTSDTKTVDLAVRCANVYMQARETEIRMKVTVLHLNQDRNTGAVIGFDAVAEVDAQHTKDIDAALEYAYRWTNNVSGSWSIKQRDMTLRDGTMFENGDYNDDVTVLAPLHKGGVGLRSTSMFDRLVVDGTTYRVATFGFEPVETA